jgi:hypothetical protein
MIHLALRIAYALFLVWFGLVVLLSIALGVAMLFGRLSAGKEAQEILDEADAFCTNTKGSQ